MNRRNVFFAMLMAPFAAFASSSKEAPPAETAPIQPASIERGKVVRVLYHPGVLSDEARDYIQRSFDEAIKNDKVVVLEKGMTYHEFYGVPGPVVVADGSPLYAYTFERDENGDPKNMTARLIASNADGVFTFTPSDAGKEINIMIPWLKAKG